MIYTIFKFVIKLGALIYFSTSHATDQINETKQVQPEKSHEICLQLMSKETLHYSFNSTAALDFNLHYHMGKHIAYPVKLHEIKQHSSSFTAKVTHTYCLMWRNKSDKVIQLDIEHNTIAY